MAFSKKQKYLFLISSVFILAIIILIVYSSFPKKLENGFVKVTTKNISVEIASSRAQQYQGLSNRESICADCGMLFVFPDKQIRKFVMRDMKFPLDIIFISDNKIINIEEKLKPEGAYPEIIYSSVSPANKVLEVNSAYVEENNIKVGDEIATQK